MVVILVEFALVDELPAPRVRRVTVGEPVLLFTPNAWQGRSRRAFFELDAPRRVSGWDHASCTGYR